MSLVLFSSFFLFFISFVSLGRSAGFVVVVVVVVVCFVFLVFLLAFLAFVTFFRNWVRELAGIWMLFSLAISLHQQFTEEATSERLSTMKTELESGTDLKSQPQIDASFVSS